MSLEVVVVEHLFQYLLVVCIAEGVFDRTQIGDTYIFPTILVFIGLPATTLAKASVANLSVVHQNLSASGIDSLCHLGIVCPGNALIALAMVVGTNVEDGMVFTVVPADALSFAFDEGEEWCRTVCPFLTALHLGIKPTAGNDCCSLQELQRTTAFHFTADDTLQIILHGQNVDGNNLVFFDNKFQDTLEGLRLLSLPVETLSDGDIMQSERTFTSEGQFLINVVAPANASFGVFCYLLTNNFVAFGVIGCVHAEPKDSILHDADRNLLAEADGVFFSVFAVELFRFVRQLCYDGFQGFRT